MNNTPKELPIQLPKTGVLSPIITSPNLSPRTIESSKRAVTYSEDVDYSLSAKTHRSDILLLPEKVYEALSPINTSRGLSPRSAGTPKHGLTYTQNFDDAGTAIINRIVTAPSFGPIKTLRLLEGGALHIAGSFFRLNYKDIKMLNAELQEFSFTDDGKLTFEYCEHQFACDLHDLSSILPLCQRLDSFEDNYNNAINDASALLESSDLTQPDEAQLIGTPLVGLPAYGTDSGSSSGSGTGWESSS